jgi:hypothetical protein
MPNVSAVPSELPGLGARSAAMARNEDQLEGTKLRERSAAGLLAGGLILLLIGAGVLLVANGWEIFKAASVSGSDSIAKNKEIELDARADH